MRCHENPSRSRVVAVPLQLRGITWNHPRGILPFVESSRLYALSSQVLAIWEAYAWDDFRERQFKELRQRSPYYDLIQFDHPWVGSYASNRWLEPLDPYISQEQRHYLESRFPRVIVDSYRWDDKLWALPVDMGAHVSFWRQDILESLSLDVPRSWEEVLEAGRVLRDAGYMQPYGFANKTYQGFLFFVEILAEFGTLGDGFPHAFVSEDALRALELIEELGALSHHDSARWNPWDVVQAVVEEGVVIGAPSVFGYVDATFRYEHSPHIITCLVPKLEATGLQCSLLGGVGLGINHTSTHKPESFQYSLFNIQPDTCRMMLEHNGQPVVQVASHIKEIEQFMEALRENVEISVTRPRSPNWPQVELDGGELMTDLFHGRRAVEVLREMQKAFSTLSD